MYGIGNYYLSKNIVEVPFLLIFTLIYAIMYPMVGLAGTFDQFAMYYVITLFSNLVGSSLGMLLSTVILDQKIVSASVILIMLPLILFSGLFKNREDLPVWIGWVEYISPLKYSFIALLEN